MSIYGQLLSDAINLLMTEFNLFGWTVSYWDVFLFDCILAVLGLILWELLH